MWIAIVLIVSLLLAATYSPKQDIEDARSKGLGDSAFPKSGYGGPVPALFGTCEQKAPIVMWYGHFQPLAQYEEVRTGAFSSDRVITSYRYLMGFDLGVCLGPGIILEQIKLEGGKVVWDGRGGNEEGGPGVNYANVSIPLYSNTSVSGGIEFFPGNFKDVQTKSPYMSAGPEGGPHWQTGAGVINLQNYAGICHVVFVQFYIGDDNTVPPRFSFVVKNLNKNLSNDYSVMSNNLDVNPMEIVYTVLTQKWGFLGLDTSVIDTDSFLAAAETLHTEGFGMSMLIDGEKPVKDILEECMRVADGVLYQEPTNSKFKVKLIRNDYDIETLLVLDESNIIGDLENFGRTTRENTYNQLKVNYQSRNNAYQSQVVLIQDHGDIKKRNGEIRSTTINFPGIKDDNLARTLAARELELLSSPLLKCTIKANRVAKDLRPGDVFKLNWAPYGMTNAIMRVVKIDFGTLTNNEISIDCVQDRFAQDLVSFEFPEETAHTVIDVNAVETTEFFIWEPPIYFNRGKDYMKPEDLAPYDFDGQAFGLVVAEPPTERSTNFNVYVATDFNDKYNLAAGNQQYVGIGTLDADFYPNKTTKYDAASGVTVSGLSQRTIDSLVQNTTFDEAKDGTSLVLIGNELFIYVGFTDLGDGQIEFGDLYGDILGTENYSLNGVIAAGNKVRFLRKNTGVLNSIFPSQEDLRFKIATKTPIGELDISTVSPTTRELLGLAKFPYRPQKLQINGARPTAPIAKGTKTITWQPRSRLDPQLYHYMENANADYLEEHHSNGALDFNVGVRYLGVITDFGNTSSYSRSINLSTVTGDVDILVRSYYELPSGFKVYSEYDEYPVTLF